MNTLHNQRNELDELRFDGLYVDESDELYPSIRSAIGNMTTKLRRRKHQTLAPVHHIKKLALEDGSVLPITRLKHHRI